MTEDQIGQLIYLVTWGVLMAGALLLRRRVGMNKAMQNLALWGLIFVGALAAAGLWQDIRGTMRTQQMVVGSEGRIELPRAPDGHYYLTLDLNGAPVRFVVDTGASSMVLTRRAAERAGFAPDNLHFLTEAMTANGAVQTARVVLDSVAVGPFEDTRVPAYVNGGEMDRSLLGMSYLNRFSRLEISDGMLVLQR